MKTRNSAFGRSWLYAALGVSMCVCLPSLANASVLITVDDQTDSLSIQVTGTDIFNLTAQSSPEVNGSPGSLGSADAAFEYISATPLAPGSSLNYLINILEPGGNVSDTMNVVLTGHTPATGDLSNVSVDFHFRSECDIGCILLAFDTPNNITETGLFQTLILGGIPNFGNSDLSISFRSDVVPLPAALPLFASGLGALGLLGWRRKRKGAALAA